MVGHYQPPGQLSGAPGVPRPPGRVTGRRDGAVPYAPGDDGIQRRRMGDRDPMRIGAGELRRLLDRLVEAGAPGAAGLVRERGAACRPPAAWRIYEPAGRLSLDDTLERWLPGLLAYGDQVTVRQLLNHTAASPASRLLAEMLTTVVVPPGSIPLPLYEGLWPGAHRGRDARRRSGRSSRRDPRVSESCPQHTGQPSAARDHGQRRRPRPRAGDCGAASGQPGPRRAAPDPGRRS